MDEFFIATAECRGPAGGAHDPSLALAQAVEGRIVADHLVEHGSDLGFGGDGGSRDGCYLFDSYCMDYVASSTKTHNSGVCFDFPAYFARKGGQSSSKGFLGSFIYTDSSDKRFTS